MQTLIYNRNTEQYQVSFRIINRNVVEIKGEVPIKTDGFMLSRDGKEWNGDYSDYTTVYRQIGDRVQFSNDGSVYVPPEPPTPPEPYIPTLEEVKAQKIVEMNAEQQMTIQNGIDVTLMDGTVEHFSLSDRDQGDLTALKDDVNEGATKLPWHVDDESMHCKYYSNEDMRTIITAAKQFATYHVTYFRDLRIYINSMLDKESVESVWYGMYIPLEYQSEVLMDMYIAKGIMGDVK